MRPIGARALKSAIDTLRPWLDEARVVDLFAGQGRFGIEALEEAASHVTFIEKNLSLAKSLAKTVERFGTKATVKNQDALDYLDSPGDPFDILFADPPFALWTPEFSSKLIALAAKRSASAAIFLVKHPSRMLPSLAFQGFSHWKSTPFGESSLIYFRYVETAS